MDLLSQYKQEHPEAFSEKPQWQPPAEYGFWIRLVMRLSRGKIQDVNTATKILIIAAGVVLLIALIIFFGIPGSGPRTVPLLRQAHPDIVPR